MKKGVVAVFCGLVLCLVIVSTNKDLDRYRTPESALAETFYLPDSQILKIASLGFESFLADILWVKLILYYGSHALDDDNPYYEILKNREHSGLPKPVRRNEHKSATDNNNTAVQNGSIDFSRDSVLVRHHSFNLKNDRYVYPLLRRIVALDEHFIPPYEFGGLVMLQETSDVTEAESLLQYGLEKNPLRWEFPYHLGYIELFYKGNDEAALKWLSRAMALPQRPAFFENLYQSFIKKRGDSQIYIDYLDGLYRSTDNDKIKKNIALLIAELKRKFPPRSK